MTERRTRGAGPGGRGDRRTSRSARSRPAADHAAASRAPRRRAESEKKRERKLGEGGRRSRRADRPERTFLGLSTGRAVILAMVVFGLGLTLAVPMRTYFSQRAEAAQLAEDRQLLEADVAELRDRRVQQQDPAYIRAEARDRLRLVLPGETPYIVQVPGIEAPPVAAAPTRSREPDPWYTDLWRTLDQPPPTPEGPR
ncbi:FtsB family cell division protein [Nocardia asteroides]|uniref:FtsB family cell division protein n=1 Tax=Nocardia asteroides TaxID=1824 RepID=UPI001E5B54BA|nr:septum formation initiator family protein [Nocardia asteroides]UGT64351.1 septum formation initiator family protein [Nocardia asteroides]